MDIMTRDCQFRLLTQNSFIGQFVHPVRGEGIGPRVWNWENRYFRPQRVYLLQNRKIWCEISVVIYPLSTASI